jgi:hypothetical protein
VPGVSRTPASTTLFYWKRQSTSRAGVITEPFRCLGFARYEGHEVERPMAGWLSAMALAV